jgi:hypothetical protein
MILGETPQERGRRHELRDDLLRLSQEEGMYIDQFTLHKRRLRKAEAERKIELGEKDETPDS